jgi:hypothetical protein
VLEDVDYLVGLGVDSEVFRVLGEETVGELVQPGDELVGEGAAGDDADPVAGHALSYQQATRPRHRAVRKSGAGSYSIVSWTFSAVSC